MRAATKRKGIIMKKQYFVDMVNEKVYVDPMFVKKAGQFGSPEFNKFMELRSTLPGFNIEEKNLNVSKKNVYSELTYEVSDAFNIYERFSEKFPNMRVVIEAPKRRASTYIPYNKMVLYISYQENAKDLLDEFNTIRQQSNAFKNPYQHVYDWFATKFPAYGKPVKKAS